MSTSPKISEDVVLFWTGVASPFFILAWLIPVILLRTWVISALWLWYVVPGFGAAPLRMSIAFGLSLLAGIMIPSSKIDKSEDGAITKFVVVSFITPLITLLFGYVGSFFV